MGCRVWGRTESDTTEQQQQQLAVAVHINILKIQRPCRIKKTVKPRDSLQLIDRFFSNACYKNYVEHTLGSTVLMNLDKGYPNVFGMTILVGQKICVCVCVCVCVCIALYK